MKVVKVRKKGWEYEAIYSAYAAAGGLSGFQFYLRDGTPEPVTRFWMTFSLCFILPQVFIICCYYQSALEFLTHKYFISNLS